MLRIINVEDNKSILENDEIDHKDDEDRIHIIDGRIIRINEHTATHQYILVN